MAVVPSPLVYVTGQVVTAAQLNGNPGSTWGQFLLSPPLVILRQTITQSLATGVAAAVTFDVEDVDRDNGHSTTTNPSRYTPQTPGYYLLTAVVDIAANAAHTRQAAFRINGTTVFASTEQGFSPEGDWVGSIASVTPLMNGTSDYVEVLAFQNTGGALSTSTTNGGCRFTAHWIST